MRNEEIVAEFVQQSNPRMMHMYWLQLLENTRSGDPLLHAFACIGLLELLVQLHAGKMSQSHHAARWVRFSRAFLGWEEEEAKVLYQFRNAVVHQGGTYAWDNGRKREYRFHWEAGTHWLRPSGTVTYAVDPLRLEEQVQMALDAYGRTLVESEPLAQNFNRVFRKIGWLPNSPGSR